MKPTAVLLSIAASVKRHGIDPWMYLKHVLTELPARAAGAELADLLPDLWGLRTAGPVAGERATDPRVHQPAGRWGLP